MGHFAMTASACRFLSLSMSVSPLPSTLLVLWRKLIHSSCTVFYGWREKKEDLEIFEAFDWPLPQTSRDTYCMVICCSFRWFFSLSLSVSLYLSLSGYNGGSLTSEPKARHDGSPAWRLLTSACVLFNNSLNHPATPSLLRNVTQPLTEVTQAPPLSHPSFTERERDREREREQKQEQLGVLRQLSPPHLPI